MTDHTTDPFDLEGVTETQRAAGLNAALHIYNGLDSADKLDKGVEGLLSDAEAISQFLNNGTLPA
ncbi:hypothetical protein SEA_PAULODIABOLI_199 [Microbacterium phage PauloDiaboli]|nr:hypothetical protein SEA_PAULODIABOLI_199 [Microbacterium phage PauloDiaboli]